MYVECAACEKFSFFCLSDINEETQNRFKISDIHTQKHKGKHSFLRMTSYLGRQSSFYMQICFKTC